MAREEKFLPNRPGSAGLCQAADDRQFSTKMRLRPEIIQQMPPVRPPVDERLIVHGGDR